ncbi:Ig-like domain-containing protein [Xylanibacter ruminicola]|uniref:Ig-like domain-containing protein n=1 Tax=Xylanibacter ruminicola TaxID=839 RepID=UPI00048AB56F|nr:Ig-like domain-containing protein [Xylanibacter ruminicola]
MKKNYFKNLMQVSLLLGAAFVISSCDDVIGQEDNPVASYVQWKTDPGAEVTMKIGDKKIIATATAVSSAIIAYESDNTEVATVDPVTGEVEAIAEGEANISAVISGMSTNGRSVFEPTKLTYKVIVMDANVKLKSNIESYVEYTVNNGSTFEASEFFVPYPAEGCEIQYSLWEDDGNGGYNPYTGNSTIDMATGKFTVGSDKGTVYIHAKVNNIPDGYEKKAADEDNWTAMVKVDIKESIAYMNEEGKREILTADKYKELDLNATSAVEAGTYYVKNGVYDGSKTIDIKGDVTLIFKNGWGSSLQNLDDKTDNATLNIFGEAIPGATAGTYEAWNPNININTWNNVANCITNFKEINIYAGTLTTYGGIVVKDVNVYAGALNAYSTGTSKYAMKLSGKLTVNGGLVLAQGQGSDTETSFAVIGDVVLNKGSFQAYNDDYRAVKGSLTAATGFQFLQGDTSDKTKATAIEGTTSNSKYIWGQAVPKK